jgi:hypothetical protein
MLQQNQQSGPPIKQIGILIAVVVGVIFLITAATKMFTSVSTREIVVVQAPFSGERTVYIGSQPGEAGIHLRKWGTVRTYDLSYQHWFSAKADQGGEANGSIKVRFNDGGYGQLSGSVRIDMPLDKKDILALDSKFGSMEEIKHALIQTNIEKAVYMTGPLMSSKESSNTRRTDLISFIEDQARYGIYKTRQKEVKVKDEISGEDKTITQVDIIKDTTNGSYARQERSPLEQYNVKMYNLSINSLDYDKAVDDQIKQQQALAMRVQTSVAEAKQAEQEAITIAKQGEAKASSAKWEQEAEKAKAVTKAQQDFEVQQLATKTAQAYKEQQIAEGQGEGEKKRLSMQANGALEQKLEAWVTVNKAYADAMKGATWVPTIQMGIPGSGSGGQNAASDLINLLQAKTARDIGLQLTPR